ncbi:MAG: zinc-ribbon domain-containing protein [Pseudomonadota bacterium]
MIITCEECGSRYEADRAQFEPEGRKVRCADCGHVWFQAPVPDSAPDGDVEADAPMELTPSPATAEEPEDAVVIEPDACAEEEAPADEPADDELRALDDVRMRAQAREQNRLTPLKAAGWLALIGGTAAATFGAYTYPDAVVSAWPQTATAYEVLGRPVNARGLEIQVVSHRIAAGAADPVLKVEGVVENVSAEPQIAPLLRGSLRAAGAGGGEERVWTFPASDRPLQPGERAEFVSEVPAPAGPSDLEVRFIRRDDLSAPAP